LSWIDLPLSFQRRIQNSMRKTEETPIESIDCSNVKVKSKQSESVGPNKLSCAAALHEELDFPIDLGEFDIMVLGTWLHY
jgi:hypothetical protein